MRRNLMLITIGIQRVKTGVYTSSEHVNYQLSAPKRQLQVHVHVHIDQWLSIKAELTVCEKNVYGIAGIGSCCSNNPAMPVPPVSVFLGKAHNSKQTKSLQL